MVQEKSGQSSHGVMTRNLNRAFVTERDISSLRDKSASLLFSTRCCDCFPRRVVY